MTSRSRLSRARAVALLAIVFLAAPAARAAAPAPPQTAAGKVFAAWLAAFNSADPAKLRAFDAACPRAGTPPAATRLVDYFTLRMPVS